MLDIAGGTYLEHCLSPHWEEFYGSGLRAAAATCRLSDSVSLAAYVPPSSRELAEAVSVAFGVNIAITESQQLVRFEYSHGLSVPIIHPDPCVVRKQAPIRLNAKNVLRFGFIEGEAVVTAESAVYDPQSAYDPRPFRENGSTSKRLAVVLNGREVWMLSGERDAAQGARRILTLEKAEAVVVKQGSRGALVVTESGAERISVIRTLGVGCGQFGVSLEELIRPGFEFTFALVGRCHIGHIGNLLSVWLLWIESSANTAAFHEHGRAVGLVPPVGILRDGF